MATKPSTALEALADELEAAMEPHTAASPITWGDVIAAARTAQRRCADAEYADYMGEDM